MICKLEDREKLIARYVNQDMAEAEMRDFEAHYFACEDCSEALKWVDAGIELIHTEGAAAFQVQPDNSVLPWYINLKNTLLKVFGNELPGGHFRPNYGRLSIAFALLALMAFAPFFYRDYQVGNIYAGNFTPHERLESRMSQFQRSAGAESAFFPENDENFSANILFRWMASTKASAETQVYELLILNNQQEELFRESVRNTEFVFTKTLKPGLYYWVLLEEGSQLHIGRFYYQKPFFFSP